MTPDQERAALEIWVSGFMAGRRSSRMSQTVVSMAMHDPLVREEILHTIAHWVIALGRTEGRS